MSSRVDMLLGSASGSASSSSSSSSSAIEFNEEDFMFSTPDDEIDNQVSSSPVVTSRGPEAKNYTDRGSSSSTAKEIRRVDPFGFMRKSRRWIREKDPGLLSMNSGGESVRPLVIPRPTYRGGPTADCMDGRSLSRLNPNRDALHATPPCRDIVRPQSAPRNVPDWTNILEKQPAKELAEDDDSDFGNYENEEWLPPHELIAQSQSQMANFAMSEGSGWSLKGREQTFVRNAVLRQTGFITDR